MTPRDAVEQFSDGGIRRSKALRYGIGIAVLGVLASQIARTLTPFTSIFFVLAILGILGFGVAMARAFLVGISLDDHGVIVRTVGSTRSWRWDDLRAARVHERATMSRTRDVVIPSRLGSDKIQVTPILELNSGKSVRLYGLRIQVLSDESLNWVDDAIRAINDRLEKRRAATGAG